MNLKWLLAHATLVKATLLFVQLQKILLTLIWFNEHVAFYAAANGTDCGPAKTLHHNHRFENANLVPWSCIFLSISGMALVLVQKIYLLACFFGLDFTYGFLMYYLHLIDTIFLPFFTLASCALTGAYIYILMKAQEPEVNFGKTFRSIPSPTKHTTNSSISESH